MLGQKVRKNGGETVEVCVVLKRDVYELVERISRKLGMEPSSWIELVLSSKVRGESREDKNESHGLG